ncbi:dermonecrotic toxin domain-containing protein [Pseudomonas kitaguniensis]|uniref:dermonecrotic toxin domain-containing protein n=1 Tax=Pseudomonas kitaguniensis TaxID=2607908 RepID=UPI003BA0E8A4
MSTRALPSTVPVAENVGIHYPFIKQKIPTWLSETALPRITALTSRQHAQPIADAAAHSPMQRSALAQSIGAHWAAQNTIDQKLAHLNDIGAFAEPLLKNALMEYGDIDVRQTFIRLYTSTGTIMPGLKSRTLSLLNAALHNFAASETFKDFAFLSAADARGQQALLTFTHKTTGQALTATGFKSLCRALDIGARYQQQVRTALGFGKAAVSDALRLQLITQHKAALNSAAHMALANKHIAPDAYALVQALLRGESRLQLDGRDMQFHTLDLLETRLTGVLVIGPRDLTPFGIERVLVYIPEDRQHPLKEYLTFSAFGNEFAQRLRGQPALADTFPASYPQFISQFIAHEQRGSFFAVLKQRLYEWQRDPKPAVEGPVWTEEAIGRPNLQWQLQAVQDDTQNRSGSEMCDDIWQYVYRVNLNKVINDANEVAVSTAYADRMARTAWWDNLEKIASDIFNLALLVITPFVPFLGELMLAYTAYQLANDVFEGILDWAQGQRIEATEHLLSAVQNVVQGLIFERGGKILEVARVKLSPFVEGLKPVLLANDETRLWNPDPTPYQHKNVRLPADIIPDEAGRHAYNGNQIVRVDDQHYLVRQDPITDDHHLIHPVRPDAYRPLARLNGSGACVLESEAPRGWSDAQLLRRLGPQTQGLSDSELEQIRVISGVGHDAVRHMYVNNQPAPPLLTDTLKRFVSAKNLKASIASILGGRELDPSAYWFEQMVSELKGWPKNKALHVYARSDYTGAVHQYGNPAAEGSDVLTMNTAEVMAGKLPEKVVAFLDQAQIDTLLGDALPADQQPQALRELLASYVERQTESFIQNISWPQEVSTDPDVQLLRTQYPELPLSIARQLLRHTRKRHLKVMQEEQRLPLDTKNQLHELDFEVTSTRLFEQMEYSQPLSSKAESLILNTLLLHSDAMAGLRIEVREGSISEAIRCATGASDAPVVRVLVRDQKGRYRVFDLSGKKLHGPSDFYSATQRCLISPTQFTEGESLRRWVVEKTIEPATRRQVLADAPFAKEANRETLTLLKGGNTSRLSAAPTPETAIESVQRRIKTVLPNMSGEGVRRFAQASSTPEGSQVLKAIEAEGKAVHEALLGYMRRSTRWPKGSRGAIVARQARKSYADKLQEAWRQGYTREHDPFSPLHGEEVVLDLSELPKPDSLPTLPDLKHVTRLYMGDCEFSSDRASFLGHFPNLNTLSLEGNLLETLPAPIAHMRSLEELNLRNNRIMLDPQAIRQLRTLSRLRRLNLADNPLGAAPDISLMPELNILQLGNTRITEWPAGLFDQPRNESFIMELHGNPITTLPEAVKGSDQALVIALTRLDRNHLSAEDQALFESHRESAGLDPHRTYEPMGNSEFWVEGMDDESADAYRTGWDDLEYQPGSQGFFEVIKALEPPDFFQDPADESLYERNIPHLRSQVRKLLLTTLKDAELRERLFKMSSFPGLCPDAGRQIFNEMGIEVEATRARLFSKTPAEQETKLRKLAKGAARLKMLNSVARADIAYRLKPVEEGGLGLRFSSQMVDGQPGTVDEVEVYLAYQTRLARRLDLPWISEQMLYRDTADVQENAINQAHAAVLALSEGDGLVDQMLLEPYWEQFLVKQYTAEYDYNRNEINQQFERLDQLHEQMQTYAQSPPPDEAQKAQKLESLTTLASQLNLLPEQVTTGQPLSDALYSQVLNDLGNQRKQWLREKTHESLSALDAE